MIATVVPVVKEPCNLIVRHLRKELGNGRIADDSHVLREQWVPIGVIRIVLTLITPLDNHVGG